MVPFFPFGHSEFVIDAEEDEDEEDAGFENEDSGGDAMPSPTPSVAVAATPAPAAFDYSLFDDDNLLDEVLETSSWLYDIFLIWIVHYYSLGAAEQGV